MQRYSLVQSYNATMCAHVRVRMLISSLCVYECVCACVCVDCRHQVKGEVHIHVQLGHVTTSKQYSSYM